MGKKGGNWEFLVFGGNYWNLVGNFGLLYMKLSKKVEKLSSFTENRYFFSSPNHTHFVNDSIRYRYKHLRDNYAHVHLGTNRGDSLLHLCCMAHTYCCHMWHSIECNSHNYRRVEVFLLLALVVLVTMLKLRCDKRMHFAIGHIVLLH